MSQLTLNEVSEIHKTLLSLEHVDKDVSSFQRFKLLVKYWNEGHLMVKDETQSDKDKPVSNTTQSSSTIKHDLDTVAVYYGSHQHNISIHDIMHYAMNSLARAFLDTDDITFSLYSFNASFDYGHGTVSNMRNYLVLDTVGALTDKVPSKILNRNISKIENYRCIGTLVTKRAVLRKCEQFCNLGYGKSYRTNIESNEIFVNNQNCERYMPGIKSAMTKAIIDSDSSRIPLVDTNPWWISIYNLITLNCIEFNIPYKGERDYCEFTRMAYRVSNDGDSYGLARYRDEINLHLWHGLIGCNSGLYFSASDNLNAEDNTKALWQLFKWMGKYTEDNYHKYFVECLLR